MMGNRGVLHDDARRIVRAFAVRRWIACLLEFRGRRRVVMQPRRYTELFFLDEATALSAGHRPCAECRRDDYRRFQELWRLVRPEPADADSMDMRLHADRLEGKKKRSYAAPIATLPDGTFVVRNQTAWLVRGGFLYAWSDDGYGRRDARPARGEIEVLTPRALVDVMTAGYVPAMHSSAR
jgi:hypothetical protein